MRREGPLQSASGQRAPATSKQADGAIERAVATLGSGPLTEKALAGIEADARGRWPLQACLIVHRYGRLLPGEQIMMVATASSHREAAFAAAAFLMDYLKSRAPFWKKETGAQGTRWVEARTADEAALGRWGDERFFTRA